MDLMAVNRALQASDVALTVVVSLACERSLHAAGQTRKGIVHPQTAAGTLNTFLPGALPASTHAASNPLSGLQDVLAKALARQHSDVHLSDWSCVSLPTFKL